MKQHRTPCAKCPFRRDAVPGWLGGLTPDDFRQLAQSEVRMPCHTHELARRNGIDYGNEAETAKLPQCAGRAIYWANQIKRPRDKSLLELPQDTQTCFQWPVEFVTYHQQSITRRGKKTA